MVIQSSQGFFLQLSGNLYSIVYEAFRRSGHLRYQNSYHGFWQRYGLDGKLVGLVFCFFKQVHGLGLNVP